MPCMDGYLSRSLAKNLNIEVQPSQSPSSYVNPLSGQVGSASLLSMEGKDRFISSPSLATANIADGFALARIREIKVGSSGARGGMDGGEVTHGLIKCGRSIRTAGVEIPQIAACITLIQIWPLQCLFCLSLTGDTSARMLPTKSIVRCASVLPNTESNAAPPVFTDCSSLPQAFFESTANKVKRNERKQNEMK
eukprot:scaffold54873_cov33-Prasinocladus_malaysianus.AAC.2